ncbi:Ribosomal RNA large subunit methyltransferase I [Lacunisphaera limnophila]|uniref:Ribosomal RNA large subunit methyltransferase I n=1 Tax=Lacunisphaera limnophila TaxID=1838286 RepID=A0A1D8AZG2_9BACT|nr:class I SAM-dependent rRNA methyltransferase [Lacunisphaera limnophila]AOS46265.1 Ribosomal RNA large subunit methyltransferase I [Lacunisphaera limnophila]
MSASLKLKPNANSRVLGGHPWVFANECEALLPAEQDGAVVELRDRTNRFIGTGIYNSKSQIVWRRLSRERVELDEAYLRGAITRAVERRGAKPLPHQAFQRLVWSESDDLPGVVVDQFGDTLVAQIQTLAMEQRSGLIGDLLAELTGATEIIFRNDANIRKLEGLASEVHTRTGAAWEPRWVTIDGFDYWLDLQNGQKTGFYLDQRAQHAVVAKYAAGRRVLDAFCNQGSFALHCAKAGATRVLGLDSAFDAVSQAKKNAERNDVQADFQGANVFDWFTAKRDEPAAWDLIVLDPPPFAKSKSALDGAMRGYKELNLRAMKSLTPGGVLATYTCSHHMQDTQLREVIGEAAADAKRRVHVLEFCHQPADHPVLVTMPESEYLRGYVLRVE